MIRLTQEEFNGLFAPRPNVPKTADGAPTCPYCDTPLTPASLAYWSAATDVGTDFSEGEFRCDACQRVIWRGGNWSPWIADKADLLELATDILDSRW